MVELAEKPDVLQMRIFHQRLERVILHCRHVELVEDFDPLGVGFLLQAFGARGEIFGYMLEARRDRTKTRVGFVLGLADRIEHRERLCIGIRRR